MSDRDDAIEEAVRSVPGVLEPREWIAQAVIRGIQAGFRWPEVERQRKLKAYAEQMDLYAEALTPMILPQELIDRGYRLGYERDMDGGSV